MRQYVMTLVMITAVLFNDSAFAKSEIVIDPEATDKFLSLLLQQPNTNLFMSLVNLRQDLVTDQISLILTSDSDQAADALDLWQNENLILSSIEDLQIENQSKFTKSSCNEAQILTSMAQTPSSQEAKLKSIFKKFCP